MGGWREGEGGGRDRSQMLSLSITLDSAPPTECVC